MPRTFLVIMAFASSELDLDVHAGSQIELHERVHGLRCRIDDVEETLVSPHFELLTALLVHMGRTVDGETLDTGRKRYGTADLGTCALGRRND